MIKGILKRDLVAAITVRAHELITGLSENSGGHDEGPTPHEIVEAALASCTILTCQLYANRKGWNLKSTNFSVRIDSEIKEASKS